MLLKLHISNANPMMLDWLDRNGFSVKNDWLDCTNWISHYNPDKPNAFCSLVCDFTSVDMEFDKLKTITGEPEDYDDDYVEHDAIGGDWEG